jgi:DNA polymerase III alpha subunit
MKSPRELEKIFINYRNALINSNNVANSCSFLLDELQHQYPSEICSGNTPDTKITRLTYEGLNWRYPLGVPTHVKKQTDHELAIIKKLNYSPYFLTVYDIVKFAKSKNILCQGRGSAANSIVCYSLGITSVSPEIGTMVFERFVSEARNEPPGIDVDFEHERREEVIQYIYNKFGRHRAGLCATDVHYRTKRALREVGKVMGLSTDTIIVLLTQLSGWKKLGSTNDKLQKVGLNSKSRKLLQTLNLVNEIIGFPRHLSQHVGGFVITEDRLLDELIPIENAAMPDRTVISWDKDDIDTLGILKVDVLSLITMAKIII